MPIAYYTVILPLGVAKLFASGFAADTEQIMKGYKHSQ
jgi:hypothetical protein